MKKKLHLLVLLLVFSTVCYSVFAQNNSLRITMYAGPGGTGGVMNGAIMLCNSGYNNAIDPDDAPYPGDALIAIFKGGKDISVELREPVGSQGTTEITPLKTNVFPGNRFLNRSFSIEATAFLTTSSSPVFGRIEDLTGGTGPFPLTIDGFGNGATNVPYLINASDPDGTLSKDPNRFRLVLSTNALFLRPVLRFTQVRAKRDDTGSIQTSWSVENEDSVSSYQVQSLERGEVFSTVGTVAKSGIYSFVNGFSPSKQKIRIQATMLDGSKLYSDTISIDALTRAQFSVSPNPASSGGKVTVLGTKSNFGYGTMTLLSLSGNIVSTQTQLWESGNTIQLPSVAPGVYTIRLTTDTTNITTKIVIR